MYLYLGRHTTVNTEELLGIFDLDTTTISPKTREFLKRAEDEKRVTNTTDELPKSFVVVGGKRSKVYICQISAPTLKKRLSALEQQAKTLQK